MNVMYYYYSKTGAIPVTFIIQKHFLLCLCQKLCMRAQIIELDNVYNMGACA